MKSQEIQKQKRAGRPLSFDRSHALKKAMLVFWRHGFEATSINDLTVAMEITPPSLYYAFGDKKKLFLECVSLYTAGAPEQAIIDEMSCLKFVELLLNSSVITYTGTDTPPGCLLGTATLGCAQSSADVQAAVAKIRINLEEVLRAKFVSGIKKGEIACTDPAILAATVMSVLQGLSTLARDGASRQKLLKVASFSLDKLFSK